MDKPLFSEHWYRVKSLRPKLRSHVSLHRHHYRGSIWYVLEDHTSARYHRFNTAAHQVIGLMDGRRTVHQIWQQVNTLLGDDAPVQDEIIHLLGQLHQVDALQTHIPPDLEELFLRGQQFSRQQRIGRLKNPLAVRLGLVDPDRFLDRTLPLVRYLFSTPFLLLYCALVVLGGLLAGIYWGELAETTKLQALTPSNLVLLWLAYPLVKLLHELAHAYTTKLHGGEVHEIGIMFLVFMPVPYVDASAATAFPERRVRMLVGAAGIMVEMVLAALALMLWLTVEPGIVSAICLNIVLIGGISTLLFNGNPLLRFDGYYVLADAVGIPNLAARANRYLTYLVQRYLLGMETAVSPVASPGEDRWFLFYSIASFCYRLTILAVICLYLIDTLFILGAGLAIWSLYNQIVLPLYKQFRFVLFDHHLRNNRAQAVFVSCVALTVLISLVAWLPFSSLTRFEGVIKPPDEAQLVARTDGFVEQLLQRSGTRVTAGQPLIRLRNVHHEGEMAVQQARMRELNAKFQAARINDRVESKLVQEEIAAVRGEIDRLQRKIDALQVTSPSRGIFVLAEPDTDLPGQYVQQGRLLGYVIDAKKAVARVVVTQQDQDRISQRLDAVDLRVAGALDTVLPGRLLRSVPQASHELPSAVLTVAGGGIFTPDPDGITSLSTTERLFEYEIELPVPIEWAMIGSRVHVRFDHGPETLWVQATRRLRQLFLRRLNA